MDPHESAMAFSKDALDLLNETIQLRAGTTISVPDLVSLTTPTSLHVIHDQLDSHDPGMKLIALYMLSWISSQYLDNHMLSHSKYLDSLRLCIGKVVQLASSANRDVVLMSLFVCATTRNWWDREGVSLSLICAELIAKSQEDKQMRYWAFRAMCNDTHLHGFINFPGQSSLIEGFLKRVLAMVVNEQSRAAVLRDPRSLPADHETVAVELQLLLQIPVSPVLVPLLTPTLESCAAVCSALSEVLKKSSVDEDTVAGCGRVWRLLVRILATLLLDNVEDEEMLNSLGSLAERKERFMHLFAPKNGVGVVTAPLPLLLKRSRLEAARCYLALAEALTVAPEWYEPPSVLKLLLRCLHHLLCGPPLPPTSDGTSPRTSAGKKRKHSPAPETPAVIAQELHVPAAAPSYDAAGALTEQDVDRAAHNVETVEVAGLALQTLCAAIFRPQLRTVPSISVSLGRPTAPPQSHAATSTTIATGSAAAVGISDGRASIESIVTALLTSSASVSPAAVELHVLVSVAQVPEILTASMKVYIGVHALAAQCANIMLAVPKGTAELVDSRTTPDRIGGTAALQKGLFSSPIRVHAKRWGTHTDSHISPSLAPPLQPSAPEQVTCDLVFGYVRQLASSLVMVTAEYRAQQRCRDAHPQLVEDLLYERKRSADGAFAALVSAWQACTVALAQALFDELAPVADISRAHDETHVERQDCDFPPADIPSAGHTQPSQLLGSRWKNLPQLFSSQLSQPLHSRFRPRSGSVTKASPVGGDRSGAVAGQQGVPSPGALPSTPYDAAVGSQLVLRSLHPPAVQAAIDLCTVTIKVWIEVCLATTLSPEMTRRSGLLVEALWWFLHRTSAFSVEVPAEDLAQLHAMVQELQPWLCPQLCPDNAAGLVLLLSLSHADMMCRASTSTSLDESQVLERALQWSMTSMTEAGALPGLFGWIPYVLVKMASPPGQGAEESNPLAGGGRSGVGSSLTPADVIRIQAASGTTEENLRASKGPLSLISRFLAHSLRQLSGMTVPTASEQQSPALMASMVEGLGQLLICPVLMALLGHPGLSSLHAGVSLSADGSSGTSSGGSALDNWRKILSLWLELREFAHGLQDAAVVDDDVGQDAWVNGILRDDSTVLTAIPYRVLEKVQEDHPQQQYLLELQSALMLVQAAADTFLSHQRRFPYSSRGHALRGALNVMVVLVARALSTVVVVAQPDVDFLSPLKALDKIISTVQQLISNTTIVPIREVVPAKFALPNGEIYHYPVVVYAELLSFLSLLPAPHNPQLQRYSGQWLMSILSGLCATHSSASAQRPGGAFRSAAATLAVGEEHRRVLRGFVQTAPALLVSKEAQELVLTAWGELGGQDGQLQIVLGSTTTSAPDNPATGKTELTTAPTEPASVLTRALPVPNVTGQKRTFIPTIAAAAPAFNSPPTAAKIAKLDQKPELPAVPPLPTAETSGFLKVGVNPSELDALAKKTALCGRTRQGLVPATYTAADRANLDQQSQQASQLMSQLQASQVPVLSGQTRPPLSSPILRQHEDVVQDAPGGQEIFPAKINAPKLPEHEQSRAAQQCSESTTYVSPTPALSAGAGVVQRMHSGYFHSNFGANAVARIQSERRLSTSQATGGGACNGPMPPPALSPSLAVAAMEELQRHSQAAREEMILETRTEGLPGQPAHEPGAADGLIQSADGPPVQVSQTIDAVQRTLTRLQESRRELSTATTAGSLGDAAGSGGNTTKGEELRALDEALGAAIQESHRLTGVLLELWNKTRR